MPSFALPCEDCGETRRKLEMAGMRSVTCTPADARPGMCIVAFDLPGSDDLLHCVVEGPDVPAY